MARFPIPYPCFWRVAPPSQEKSPPEKFKHPPPKKKKKFKLKLKMGWRRLQTPPPQSHIEASGGVSASRHLQKGNRDKDLQIDKYTFMQCIDTWKDN